MWLHQHYDYSRKNKGFVIRFSLTVIGKYYTFSFKLSFLPLLRSLIQNNSDNITTILTITVTVKILLAKLEISI